MKKLINQGYKRFASRKDRDYIQELLDIGITEEMAWSEIITLSAQNYVHDYKPFYAKRSDDALTFKKMINGCKVYIKIKIEEYNNNGKTIVTYSKTCSTTNLHLIWKAFHKKYDN